MNLWGFFDALSKLLLARAVIGPADSYLYIVVFGVGCCVVGALLMLLDYCYQFLMGESFLKFDRGRDIVPRIAWILAAGVTGMIGLELGVIQPSIEGCVGAAVSWQAIMTIFIGRLDPPSSSESDEDGGAE